MKPAINYYSKIICVLIYINSAIVLIPEKFKGIPIVLLLILASLSYFKQVDKPTLPTKTYLISIAFFVFLLFSISYSSDRLYAVKKLETSLSLIAFPTLFYLLAGIKNSILTPKVITNTKQIFVFSLVFFLLVSFLYFYLAEPYYTLKSTLVHYTNLVDIRSEHFSIHSIYLSIYIGAAIIFSVDLITKKEAVSKNAMYVVLLLLVVFMAILNKKGPILSLGLVAAIFLFKSRKNQKQVFYILLLTSISVACIIHLPRYNNVNKFEELINLNFSDNSSTGIRIQIYECGIKLAKQSPIIGHGWGDVKNVLNHCYSQKNNILLQKNYNSHNQYLSIFLSAGILGLLAFLYYLFFILKKSSNSNSPVLFALVLFFILNMLTENILEREDGVVLFAFFINFFLFNIKETKSKTINSNG